jgi:aspartate aminotransferase
MHVVDSIPASGIVTVRDRLLAQQAAGQRVCRLESGDPSFALPAHIAEALNAAIRDGHTHYTAGAGIPALREAAAAKVVRENRLPDISPRHVFITNGAMHALYISFRALITPDQPGHDEVIVPDPTWTETADDVTLAGGRPVGVPLFDGGRALAGSGAPADAWAVRVRAAITPRTRAIVLNSPHNPTGLVWTAGQVRALVDLAAEHGLWLLSDEAYEHIVFDGAGHLSAGASGYPRVLSVYSMSKSYAMSGLRLGYVVCPPAPGEEHEGGASNRIIRERLGKIIRGTTNGVNSATQWAGVAALNGPQDCTLAMATEYVKRRDILWEVVSRLPWLTPVKPAGAFYQWARISDARWESGWALTNQLLDHGVGSAPGEAFGPAGAGCIRFAFACATSHIEEAARRMEAISTGAEGTSSQRPLDASRT